MNLRFCCLLAACVAITATIPAQSTIRPGYIQIDDMIVPSWSIFANSGYTATPWPGGNMYYTFDPAVSTTNRTRTLQAMAEISAVANIDFFPRTTQSNYVNFRNSSGNSSYVGMIGGSQNINMYNWSYKYILCHEILHALGYIHEQSRPDRDTYVIINYGNIQSGRAGNFNISSAATTVGPYDFESIMHYGQYGFSSNGQPTIEAQPAYVASESLMGNRSYLSPGDAAGLAARYGAAPAPTVTSVSPSPVPLGTGNIQITVSGTRFCSGASSPNGLQQSRVLWNGTPLSTTWVDSTTLLATVPGSLRSTAGCADVSVENQTPGGGLSTPQSVGVGSACVSELWQINSFLGALSFDGVFAQTNGPAAITSAPFNTPTTLSISTFLLSTVWDAAISVKPVVSAGAGGGGLTTPSGQAINIDFTDPQLSYFNSVSPVLSLQPFPGNIAATFDVKPSLATVSMQAAFVTAAHPDGLVLTQAGQLNATDIACTQSTQVTLGDDDSVAMALPQPFNFYGTSYTQAYVGSNGFVTLGGPETYYLETTSGLQSGNARIAVMWDDFNPASGGTVSFASNPGGTWSVCWDQVPEYNASTPNTFHLTVAPDFGAVTTMFMTWETVSSNDGLVGIAPGNNAGTLRPLNLSSGFTALNALDVPYELWSTSAFDLGGQGLAWTLLNGSPISVR